MRSSTEDSLTSRRLLVVEDEYFIAEEIAKTLRAHGAHVVGPAPSLEAAFSLLASEQIDAAVLDLNLQGETALPLADELRARGLPFVFATGYADFQRDTRTCRCGKSHSISMIWRNLSRH